MLVNNIRENITDSALMADSARDEDASVTHAGAADFVCAICHECPNDSSVASVSGCNHRFCFDCINRWARIRNVCPLCNISFEDITSFDGVATTVGGGEVNPTAFLSSMTNEVIEFELLRRRLLAVEAGLEYERLILYLTQQLNELGQLSILVAESESSALTLLMESRIDEFKVLAEGFNELNQQLSMIGGELGNTERGLVDDIQELNDRFDSWRTTVQLARASVNGLSEWVYDH